MHHVAIARQLTQQAQTIRTLVEQVTLEQARWKPRADDWSILEVVNHLYDEEREDFRQRIDYLLHKPGEEAPSIDPQGWVTARAYNERDLVPSLQNFLDERNQSVAWLHNLRDPDWSASYTHPAGFTITAYDFLVNWAAHDLLHLRQLVELHYAWHKHQVGETSLAYAGDW
ncbi:MAG: DinB family protein [Caldilineaceae bacterium]|nr:DinB family protein [Caldilineaceae bacterium]